MDSWKYSMYRFFFSIPEDAFILCIGFFNRFRKMLLEAEIIDSVFYVCHHDYIYVCMCRYVCMCTYIYICVYICVCIYLYMYTCIFKYEYEYIYIYIHIHVCIYNM